LKGKGKHDFGKPKGRDDGDDEDEVDDQGDH
jgi:hypothetical protein